MSLISVTYKNGETEEFTGSLQISVKNGFFYIYGDCEDYCITQINPDEIRHIIEKAQ